MKPFRLLLIGAAFCAASTARAQTPAPYVPLSQRPLLQIPAPKPSPWESEIAAFEKADKARFPPRGAVLFTGSSSIRLWDSLATDFPFITTLNRGFGGSQISDSVELAPRTVWPYAPSRIIFYAGTNDINAGKSAAQVFADWQSFVARVRQQFPKIPMTFLSIVESPSRAKDVEKVRAANALIKGWNATRPNLDFFDVNTPLQDGNGKPRPELFRADQLHLLPAGYAIWRQVLTPYLTPKNP